MGNSYDQVINNSLPSRLNPISIRELLDEKKAPCSLYRWQSGCFNLEFEEDSPLNRKILGRIVKQGTVKLFVEDEGYQNIIHNIQNRLVQITRSLSVGKPVQNASKLLNLLSLNMHYLYEFPSDDTFLKLQAQCARNLCSFLIQRPAIHHKIIQDYIEQKHHYIFAQPILSSLFLVGILTQSKLIDSDNIQRLFMVSLFKDLGMSAVPIEKYELEELDHHDKQLLLNHSEHSVNLLSGRGIFDESDLHIIANHHAFSLLEDQTINEILEKKNLLVGMETVLVSTVDIISAMISKRPYRQAGNLYDALELTKILISEKYPVEFKLIVTYFRELFKN